MHILMTGTHLKHAWTDIEHIQTNAHGHTYTRMSVVYTTSHAHGEVVNIKHLYISVCTHTHLKHTCIDEHSSKEDVENRCLERHEEVCDEADNHDLHQFERKVGEKLHTVKCLFV
jgi:hypothetical protein